MSKDGERENFQPDPTATRDIGGAYGGDAGTMAGAAPDHRVTGDHSSGPHPMSHTDAADTSTAQTDHREDAQSPDRGLGQEWTGESAPDQEFRDNPPTRRSGEGKDTAANDAF